MSERPVRLIVSGDLRRGRGSVFFRLWFAIPFLLWLLIWSIAAFFVAIVNWVTTLFRGTSPDSLHRFLARFVRYATHTYAYLSLAAEHLPHFDGRPGYAIDVEIDPPVRQNRWIVAFRLVLAFPAFFLLNVLVGGGRDVLNSGDSSGGGSRTISLLTAAAFLGWFVALVRGRMPRGLRDLIAYALSYGAQFWAYLLLVTERYPSSDPLTAIGTLPTRNDPIQLESRDDLRRSRLTVFFRILLAIPHVVWLSLWGVVAFLAAIVNWLATLFRGSSPEPLHRFLVAFLRYQTHVGAFLFLIGNPFPGFTGAKGTYPIELRVADRAPQNRWTVFFRALLALPALFLAGVYGSLLFTVAVLGWFAALARGQMPVGLRNAGALALRYTEQTYGYLFLLTGAYPYSGPCLEPRQAIPVPAPVPPAAPVAPPVVG